MSRYGPSIVMHEIVDEWPTWGQVLVQRFVMIIRILDDHAESIIFDKNWQPKATPFFVFLSYCRYRLSYKR
ncbi:hypothetical protein KDN24_01730 [Bacillus sp. Bva_UNVM-123]|uniref:hypothetical protein n=1 Tax=Bacillus sp. Bva_UNVM-123 TaxID=2829798 RepID=UPI00391FC495